MWSGCVDCVVWVLAVVPMVVAMVVAVVAMVVAIVYWSEYVLYCGGYIILLGCLSILLFNKLFRFVSLFFFCSNIALHPYVYVEIKLKDNPIKIQF